MLYKTFLQGRLHSSVNRCKDTDSLSCLLSSSSFGYSPKKPLFRTKCELRREGSSCQTTVSRKKASGALQNQFSSVVLIYAKVGGLFLYRINFEPLEAHLLRHQITGKGEDTYVYTITFSSLKSSPNLLVSSTQAAQGFVTLIQKQISDISNFKPRDFY